MRAQVTEVGVSLVLDNGQTELVSIGIPLLNADGSVTIRIPARDVDVVAPMNPLLVYDMSDVQRLILAVVRGGITIAQIAAVRPAVAVAVQTFMTNHGLVAGSTP